MLLFVGQVGTDMKGREAFQEIDYRAMFGTVAKWAVEIERSERIPEIVARAWSVAVSGRPGPVVIALPEDVLSAPCEAPALTGPARLVVEGVDLEGLARGWRLARVGDQVAWVRDGSRGGHPVRCSHPGAGGGTVADTRCP